jgi:hypothetical protein
MSLLKKVPFIMVALALLVAQSALLASPAYAATSAGKVYAKEVEEDKTVTVVGSSLRANTRYDVYLSKFGKYPGNAIRVGFVRTDGNGAFTQTFKIPGKLVDIAKISITLVDNRGDTASNWFINASSDSNTGGEGSPTFSFKVTKFKKNDWVRIKTSNLPANVTFDVRMGKAGSEGINGTVVGELRSSKGGSVTETFDIPDSLEGKSQIDIRVENRALGIAAYVTFKNK